MRFFLVISFITVSLWLSGCAARGIGTAPPDRTWTRKVEQVCDGNRDKVWSAVLGALSGYSLKQRDPAKGVAVTAWKSTIVPHDLKDASRVILLGDEVGDYPSVIRIPPRWLNINFEVHQRLMVGITEDAAGKTLISISRQMYVTYPDGPEGIMNPDVYERLRGDFDKEEDVNMVLRNIIDTVSGSGK